MSIVPTVTAATLATARIALEIRSPTAPAPPSDKRVWREVGGLSRLPRKMARRDGDSLLRVVVELHLPAPLALVLGVPPLLENAGFPAGEDDQPSQVGVSRPAVLERDLALLAHKERHGAFVVALQLLAPSHDPALVGADGDLQRRWCGVHQEPV